MSVNIQVTAETAQAAKAMVAFTTQASAGLKVLDVTGKQASAGLLQMTATGTAVAASMSAISANTATATNGLNVFTAAAIRSALASNNIVHLNGAAARGAAEAGNSLKKTTGDLNNAIRSVAIAASTFAGPTASSLLMPFLLFGREIKTLAGGMKLLGLSIPVLATGIVGLGAILAVGSFYFSDYRKATEKQTEAEESAITTNAKLADSILTVARARREAGAMTEETFNRILRSLKSAENQVTVEGTAASLLGLRRSLRSDPEFTPPVSRSSFERGREDAALATALQIAKAEAAIAQNPNALKDNNFLRLDELDRALTALNKRRIDSAAARETKIISEQEYRKLEITDLTEIAALETRRLDIFAQRINANFRLTEAEKFEQLRGAGVPKEQLGADPSSMMDQMSLGLTSLANQWGTLQQQIAGGFYGTINQGVNSVSDGLTGLILKTEGWEQRLAQIPQQILGGIVGSIVQLGVRWITTQLLMATTGKGILASSIAATAPLASAQALIWATPAALATIATYGGAAAASPFQVAAAQALITAQAAVGSIGFLEGGFTGRGANTDVAGVVHRNEFVMDAETTSRVGVRNLELIRAGKSPVAATGGGGSQVNQTINAFFDRGAFLQASRDDIGAIALEFVRNNKVELGFQT